ncbi:unnamed protein product [Chironomus riparius]|uniref:Complex I-15 kDa n=1 Tax=Chironomus riparius TaxID=315576 RepID=A0A9N9RGK7_9DIPT|nr:unnamed protein product [Chironomus riparius]
MPLTPFFRSPFTDFTGGLINAQHYDKCGQFELDVVECLEAYGQDRGKLKCRDLIEDFNECLTMTKRTMRALAMRNERTKQYWSGELKEKYQNPGPRIDSF